MNKTTELDEMDCPRATSVTISDHTLTVSLEDGRTISVPVEWYPRLAHSTLEERQQFEIGVSGIHWEQINADVSIKGLILGWQSGESSKTFQRWLDHRAKGEAPWLKPDYNGE